MSDARKLPWTLNFALVGKKGEVSEDVIRPVGRFVAQKFTTADGEDVKFVRVVSGSDVDIKLNKHMSQIIEFDTDQPIAMRVEFKRDCTFRASITGFWVDS